MPSRVPVPVKPATISLLLLAGCLTPDEHETQTRETVTKLVPLLENVVEKKVRDNFEQDLKGLEKSVEDGDDAVRKEVEEAFHTAKDERVEMRAENSRQHVMIRDAMDRNSTKDEARHDEMSRAFSKLEGKVEGTDASIQSAAGAIRGMLIGTAAQVTTMDGRVKSNTRALELVERRLDTLVEDITRELDKRQRTRQEAHFEKLHKDFWNFVEDVGIRAGFLATIVVGLGGIIAWWRRRGKEKADG